MFKSKCLAFYQSSCFVVKKLTTRSEQVKPKTKIDCQDTDLIVLRLAKAGYGGGNPEVIENMSVDWVLKMFHYENFCNDYESEYMNLNNKQNG